MVQWRNTRDSKVFQPLLEQDCVVLAVACWVMTTLPTYRPDAAERVDQTEHVRVVGDPKVAADLVFLDVVRVDDDDDFGLILSDSAASAPCCRAEIREAPWKRDSRQRACRRIPCRAFRRKCRCAGGYARTRMAVYLSLSNPICICIFPLSSVQPILSHDIFRKTREKI